MLIRHLLWETQYMWNGLENKCYPLALNIPNWSVKSICNKKVSLLKLKCKKRPENALINFQIPALGPGSRDKGRNNRIAKTAQLPYLVVTNYWRGECGIKPGPRGIILNNNNALHTIWQLKESNTVIFT